MNWKNLLKNKCPRCSKEFDAKSKANGLICCDRCDFKISESKMSEIVTKEVKKSFIGNS